MTIRSRLPLILLIGVSACASDMTVPPSNDLLRLTAAQVKSLDSTAVVLVQANPGNTGLKALVDSTLMLLTAGVELRRVDITTNLTSAPMYAVTVRRSVSRPTGSWSTFTLVALDDPAKLGSLIEISGFAQTSGGTAPNTMSGTIGDGSGLANASLFQVGGGGSVTEWRAASGTIGFAGAATGTTCPGFAGTAVVTCRLETMLARFTVPGAATTGGSTRAASMATTEVPGLVLTFTP